MSEPSNNPLPEWTPERLAAVFAEMKAELAAGDPSECVESEGEIIPFDDVIAEVEEMVRQAQPPAAGAG